MSSLSEVVQDACSSPRQERLEKSEFGFRGGEEPTAADTRDTLDPARVLVRLRRQHEAYIAIVVVATLLILLWATADSLRPEEDVLERYSA